MQDVKFRIISEDEMFVNLDWIPEFKNFSIHDYAIFKHTNETVWVRIVKVGEELFVSQKKASLYFPVGEGEKPIVARDFFEDTKNQPLNFLHPNIADAMLANQKIIPRKFREKKRRKTILFFGGIIFFVKQSRRKFLKCIFFKYNEWEAEFRGLPFTLDYNCAALLTT